MKKNQIVIGIAGIVVITFVALVVWKAGKSNPSPSELALSPSPTVSQSPAPVKKPSPASAAQDYTKLVQEYANRRIQFNDQCTAIPSSMTVNNGTKILFDNRSAQARTITVNNVKYSFVPWGYRLLTLSVKTVPFTMRINCGSGVGTASVLLQ